MTTDALELGLNPGFGELAEQMMNRRYAQNRRHAEVVIYYAKSLDDPIEPGWIVLGDSQPSKQLDAMGKGWTPLTRFGPVRTDDYYDPQLQEMGPDPLGRWGTILRHRPHIRPVGTHPYICKGCAGGPAAFPKEQVLAFGWYREYPMVRWPQLAGETIEDFDCPECQDRLFRQAIHLARHLRIQHDYTREDLAQLGKELGIDFGKQFLRKGRKITVVPDEVVEEEPEEPPDDYEAPTVTRRTVRSRRE